MASTVLRVKRRREESPLEALVLHCKRAKKDEAPAPSVFVFSGTVNEQEDAAPFIKKSFLKSQDSAGMLEPSKDIPALVSKLKERHKEQLQSNRIRILNCSRGISLAQDGGGDGLDSDYSLLDLHDCGKDGTKTEGPEHYAYDIYMSKNKDFDDAMIDEIVRIDPYIGNYVFDKYRDNNCDSVDSGDEGQDEDSNDEGNWRNDYPDSDNSIKESDMRLAMQDCAIGGDLSSDDEESNVYGNSNVKNKSDCRGVNSDDVNMYGLAYAKYKAKLLQKQTLKLDGEPSLIEYISPGNLPSGSRDSCDDSNSNSCPSDDQLYTGRRPEDETLSSSDSEDNHRF